MNEHLRSPVVAHDHQGVVERACDAYAFRNGWTPGDATPHTLTLAPDNLRQQIGLLHVRCRRHSRGTNSLVLIKGILQSVRDSQHLLTSV